MFGSKIQFFKKIIEESELNKKNRRWPHLLAIGIAIFFILAAIVFGGAAWYARIYQGQVYPEVYAGNYPLGSLTRMEVKNIMENLNNRYSKEGLALQVTDRSGKKNKIKFYTIAGGEGAPEVIRLDSDRIADVALNAGRQGNFWQRLWQPISFRFFSPLHFLAPVYLNRENFTAALSGRLSIFEDNPHNAAIIIESVSPLLYNIIPEDSGLIFNYSKIIDDIKQIVASLSFSAVIVEPEQFLPAITAAELNKALPKLPTVLAYGNVSFNYVDPRTQIRHDWTVSAEEYAPWLGVQRNSENNLIFTLQEDKVKKYLEEAVRPIIDEPPQDAKFVMEEGRVKEFQSSHSGISSDLDSTYKYINQVFQERNYNSNTVNQTVSVVISIIEPKIKTADVNNLGITDIIGAGTSTFRDSHTNRIKNIARAVKRLNGLLIKPDEEFSTIKSAGPFTAENGYLPEQIIKGKEIKLEVGGGMCQIGTTLFRMAMNSALPITERRNHSLVVAYYADPVNGNPGTDATVYAPAPDFKFLNDTGNYLLLQTSIDYKKQRLTFTLWGKPDGRRGWYSHPKVSKWIPSGNEIQEVLVDDGSLKPGAEKCQNAFRGAVASFTYTRFTPQGEKIDKVFDSYYRPLPKICMKGVEKDCKEKGTCTAAESLPPEVIIEPSEATPDVSATPTPPAP